MTTAAPSLATPLPPGGAAAAPASHGFFDSFFDAEDGGFSFHDIFSVINPLQHIPVVSTLYRAITGDTIKPLARVAGDTLYGGWMGCVSSVANIIFEKETGKDLGDTVLAFLEGDRGSQSARNVASGTIATPPAAKIATHAPTPLQGALLADDPGSTALASSMAGAHVDPEIARRALYAYRRSLTGSIAPLDLSPAI